MLMFLKKNIVLILLVAGAIVPFILSVYKEIAEKKKIRVLLILISTGFIITLCIIIISDIQKKNSDRISAELDAKKEEMIKDISAKVSADLDTSIQTLKVSKESLTLLEALQSKLSGKAIGEIAVELSAPNYDNLHVFEKGNPAQIPAYVAWLSTTLRQPRKEPAIALTVNANKHYMLELILAYLLANERNVDIIKSGLGRGSEDWRRFPDGEVLRSIGEAKSEVKYVLFYDGNKSRLLGYADATMLTRELLLYKQQGLTDDIEAILNQGGRATVKTMGKYFSSFSPMVLNADNAYDAARILIDKKVNEGVSFFNGNPWFISLANIIKLAT